MRSVTLMTRRAQSIATDYCDEYGEYPRAFVHPLPGIYPSDMLWDTCRGNRCPRADVLEARINETDVDMSPNLFARPDTYFQ